MICGAVLGTGWGPVGFKVATGGVWAEVWVESRVQNSLLLFLGLVGGGSA